MSQIIKITLLKSLAVNSVKNETFQKAVIDKAVDQKNVTVAFHEAAGDDDYHERMLARAFYSQCEMLKAWFSQYLTGATTPGASASGSPADDPLVSSEESEEGVEISLRVSDRFNLGYVKTLARLGQKYVEDRMIHLWWASSDEKKSAFYATLAEVDAAGITQCFNKTAPSAPAYNFPDAISLTFPILDQRATTPGASAAGNAVPPETLFSYPYIIAAGEETELTYVLSNRSGKKPIDDIIVRADDACCIPCLDELGHWQIRGIKPGICIITLLSRHDDRVFTQFALRVTE